MIRSGPRRRVLFVVGIALVGLIGVPIDERDDYAFFHPGAASTQAEVPADDPARSDHQHFCSCLVCVLTTDDTFVPRLQVPQLGKAVAAVPAVLCSSTFLPGIFRPPIV